MKRSREPDEDLDSNSDAGDANVELRPVAKITELDAEAVADDDHQDSSAAMKCHLPPHKDPVTFKTYSDYEAHYNKYHTNRCLECRKNFPSEHLLSVHIEEFHDPLVVVRRDKGEHTVSARPLGEGRGPLVLTPSQYSCFVEGCERKCLTHQKRRMHMIDKHMYPKNYFFALTKEGIDGRRSLLVEGGHRRRQSSISTSTQARDTRRRESLQGAADKQQTKAASTEVPKSPGKDEGSSQEKHDTEMADLTGAMSSLQFVPPSVRFGRQRAGFSKR
ncbi:hypothetical protein ACO1O0_000846 [Amphichorda felina]